MSIAKKLALKQGQSLLLLGAPDGYEKLLAPPSGVTIVRDAKKGSFDAVHAFARSKKDLSRCAVRAVAAVKEDGLLWLAYPKKSGALAADLSRDDVWNAMNAMGWQGVTLIAIDDTWSALRLKNGGAPKTRAKREDKSAEPRTIEPPRDLAKAMRRSADARLTWEKLSFTHKREYAEWITSAKKEETRTRRVIQAIEMLALGGRTPK